MCDEPDVIYIPSDTIAGFGSYSCGVCGFELAGPREAPAPTHAPTRPPIDSPTRDLPQGVVHYLVVQ